MASAVRDHVQLVWLLDDWSPWEDEFWGEADRAARVRLDIRTRRGRLVWRASDRDTYTPVFDWHAQRDGRALPRTTGVQRVLRLLRPRQQ